jgi:hypothetical protein
MQRCVRAREGVMVLAPRQIQDVARFHLGLEQQTSATRCQPLLDLLARWQRCNRRICPRFIDSPGLLAFNLQREDVVQIEVGLERLHTLEGTVDVRGHTCREFMLEQVRDCRDFRADAMDVIRD